MGRAITLPRFCVCMIRNWTNFAFTLTPKLIEKTEISSWVYVKMSDKTVADLVISTYV